MIRRNLEVTSSAHTANERWGELKEEAKHAWHQLGYDWMMLSVSGIQLGLPVKGLMVRIVFLETEGGSLLSQMDFVKGGDDDTDVIIDDLTSGGARYSTVDEIIKWGSEKSITDFSGIIASIDMTRALLATEFRQYIKDHWRTK